MPGVRFATGNEVGRIAQTSRQWPVDAQPDLAAALESTRQLLADEPRTHLTR